jgi:hypothetical protein
MIECVLTEHSR